MNYHQMLKGTLVSFFHIEHHSPLVYSSLIFLSNGVTSYIVSEYVYSFLFICLTTTSVLVHRKDEPTINLLDKIMIYCVFLKGTQLFIQNIHQSFVLNILIIGIFGFCVVSYHIGFIYKFGCFDIDIDNSQRWHIMMHILGSIGHHAIVVINEYELSKIETNTCENID
jgi:hypothetical protein